MAQAVVVAIRAYAIKMARVRPEVLTNPGYEAVEAIEED